MNHPRHFVLVLQAWDFQSRTLKGIRLVWHVVRSVCMHLDARGIAHLDSGVGICLLSNSDLPIVPSVGPACNSDLLYPSL